MLDRKKVAELDMKITRKDFLDCATKLGISEGECLSQIGSYACKACEERYKEAGYDNIAKTEEFRCSKTTKKLSERLLQREMNCSQLRECSECKEVVRKYLKLSFSQRLKFYEEEKKKCQEKKE